MTSRFNLVSTYALGKFNVAEQLQEDMLSLSRQVLGDNHPHTLTSMANLATAYCALGKLIVQVLGDNCTNISLLSMTNLASTYYALRKFNAAVQLKDNVLSLRKIMLGITTLIH